jgi:hypothetical protein
MTVCFNDLFTKPTYQVVVLFEHYGVKLHLVGSIAYLVL